MNSNRSLIATNRVEGTPVFTPDGERIGSIDFLMVEKISGQVKFAVVKFGGFLGFGEEQYALPWQAFFYEPKFEGYVATASPEEVRGAPSFRDDMWGDEAWQESLYSHYGRPPLVRGK